MTKNKYACIGYVPPTHVSYSRGFMANMKNFRTTHELILFADQGHSYGPDVIELKGNPEMVEGVKTTMGKVNPWRIGYLVFITALRILQGRGITHFLLIEADCRVGQDGWDEVMFKEMETQANIGNISPVMTGSFSCYNMGNMPLSFVRKWHKFMAKNGDAAFPIPAYGCQSAAELKAAEVFPYGALTIYDLEWVMKHFPLVYQPPKDGLDVAFDKDSGKFLVEDFGDDCFDHIIHLNSSFSTFGNIVTSEQERIDLLNSGQVVAVHQIKSEWPGPTPKSVSAPAPEVKPAVVMAPVVVNQPKVKPVGLRMDILIIAEVDTQEWLHLTLRSIDKFCRGFGQVVVAYSKEIQDGINPLPELKHLDVTVQKFTGDSAGQRYRADILCPDADLVMQVEPGMIAFQPITPDDHLKNGKAVMVMKKWDHYGRHKGVEEQMGEPVHYNGAEQSPSVHWRELYPATRQFLCNKHNVVALQDLPGLRNGTEAAVLAAMVLRSKEFIERYQFINLERKKEVRPPDRWLEWFTPLEPGVPQTAIHNLPAGFTPDKEGNIVPKQVIESILEGIKANDLTPY